jgi:triacylglycerol lipase
MTRVPATSSIKERAQMLEETIAEKFGGREVNLVGHSMVSFANLLIHPLTE